MPEIPRLNLVPQERTPTFRQKPGIEPKSKLVRRNVGRASLGPANTSLYDQVNRAEQKGNIERIFVRQSASQSQFPLKSTIL